MREARLSREEVMRGYGDSSNESLLNFNEKERQETALPWPVCTRPPARRGAIVIGHSFAVAYHTIPSASMCYSTERSAENA